MPAIPASAPQPGYAAGEVIAERYELVRLIGRGGIGQVWLAKSQTLHNEVALKLFVGGTHDGAARLLSEARAAAALEHPAIVRVFDFGESSRGDPFLVMEHLKGESLEALLQRVGPLQPSRALRLLLPLVEALAVAHGKQIIHRDIKLANLFLSVDEEQRVQPKLIDFGLARLTRGGARLTQEGMLVGSPAYMSPEQVRDAPVDARTDLWSLVVVLYELVTGRLPFAGDNQFDMFKAIVESEPLPLERAGEIDDALIAIVKRGLAKDPNDRFATARDLGVAFARWLVAHGHEDDVCGASLTNGWLKPRKISSLAPPTPAIAFVPPGLLMGLPPPKAPSAAALAPTQQVVAPSLGTTTATLRPKRRRWVVPLVGLIVVGAAGGIAWATLHPTAAPALADSAAPSASASAAAAAPTPTKKTPPAVTTKPTVATKPTVTPTTKPTPHPTGTTKH